jgi:serine/threonine protein kinase
MSTLQPGSLINEYRLLDYLGEGGMGRVYRAVHCKIGRVVAIKELTAAGQGTASLDRFLNEARIQSNLQHPNIATLYDFLEVDGHPCIIMEYVDGQTLAERIRALGPLPLSEVVFVFKAVVQAMDYTHSRGVVHRDIKSNNVKITSAGRVKLLDFGIARAKTTARMTMPGAVVGTPSHLSPEQLRGEPADTRSDIWALGVMLFEMLTSHVPFEAVTFGDLYEKIIRGSYAPPSVLNPQVPRSAEAVITRCLEKDPAKRYQSADELLKDVMKIEAMVPRPCLSDGGSTVGEKQNLSWPKRTWRTLTATASVIVLAAVAYFVVSLLFISDDGKTLPRSAADNTGNVTTTTKIKSVSQTKIIPIDTNDGRPAQVFEKNKTTGGLKPLGWTPLRYEGRLGETVNLVLMRDGVQKELKPFEVNTTDNLSTINIPTK